jgi:hypothetical protein
MLRKFNNKMLWGIFEPKIDGVTTEWRKLRNKELHNFFSSTVIIREWLEEDGTVGACGTYRRVTKSIRNCSRENRREEPLGRSWHRWKVVRNGGMN